MERLTKEQIDFLLEDYTFNELFNASKYTSQIEVVLSLIEGNNLFISGPAGSGKSYVIQKFIEYSKRFLKLKEKEIITTSTTGLSSLNIRGMTIHKATGMGLQLLSYHELLKTKKDALKEPKKRFNRAKIIIIDEISMLSEWGLNFVRDLYKDSGSNAQVIVSGDFSQLSPVAKTEDEETKKNFCYKTKSWNFFNFKTAYMDRVYRTNDEKLKKILDKISLGEGEDLDLSFLKTVDSRETKGIILVSTNNMAKKTNEEKQKLNPNKELKVFKIQYDEENTNRAILFAKSVNIEEEVKLKENDLVMALVNDTFNYDFFKPIEKEKKYPIVQNGMIGRFGIKEDEDKKRFFTFTYEDPKTEELFEYEISPHRFKETVIEEEITEEGEIIKKEKVLSFFIQIPIKLAYAISIHKSQGQTYSHLTCDLSNCWMKNLGYVALSRGKSLDGIYLLKNRFGRKLCSSKALSIDETSLDIKREIMKESLINKKKNEKDFKRILGLDDVRPRQLEIDFDTLEII